MCLKVEDPAVMTAKKDIAVYKVVMRAETARSDVDGVPFRGVINETKCEGVLSVNENRTLFFCTDEPYVDGAEVSDKKGYMYSWLFDNNVNVAATFFGKNCELPISDAFENAFITYYICARVEIGEEYESQLVFNLSDSIVSTGLHSFASSAAARKHIKECVARKNWCVVVECVIPKGSKYYVGKFANQKSYASDRLRYVKILS